MVDDRDNRDDRTMDDRDDYQMDTDVVDRELKAGIIGIRIERNYKEDGKLEIGRAHV